MATTEKIHERLYQWRNQTEEHAARIAFEWRYLMVNPTITTAFQLQQQGHMLFPAFSSMNGSLVLHALGLNPMQPLDWGLPFPVELQKTPGANENFRFYCDADVLINDSTTHFEHLNVLTELRIVLRYLDLSADEFIQRAKQTFEITQFIDYLEFVSKKESLPLHLNPTARQELKNLPKTTSFDETVRFIQVTHLHQHPTASENTYMTAEIFMDIMLLEWKVWLRCLKINPTN